MAAETRPSDSWSDSRTDSTSPSTSPSARLSAANAIDRSASPVSSILTSNSGASNNGTSQEASFVGSRRGFSRPQGTAFADSARNRDSVMSLGTIAHLQHYFARTGLLDGRGAQLAREDQAKNGTISRSASGTYQSPTSQPLSPIDDAAMNTSSSKLDIPENFEESFLSSPEQLPSELGDMPPAFILPPTVSTYKQKTTYVPPPPDLTVLRRELREALEDAKELLRDIQLGSGRSTTNSTPVKGGSAAPPSEGQGMYELQGLQILDLVTLAIRAAKNFYTSHEQPLRLYAIKSERQIRTDLFSVLEVLKKMASRNFAGGVRKSEIDSVRSWIAGIEDLVSKDEQMERREHEQMQAWAKSDTIAKDQWEREWAFLSSFDKESEPLPRWTAPPASDTELPTPFLKALQDGRRLVRLHNQLVRKSRRHFELIKSYHKDVAKPYRMAENLQFWAKAAERRWDTPLAVDFLGVVHGDQAAAWRGFDAALLLWSKNVREEMAKEWRDHLEKAEVERPVLRMDPGNEVASPW